jgi:sortase A
LNKYLLLILGLLILTIFAFDHYGSGTPNKHFDNGEISFDYSSSWNETNGTGSNVVSFTDNNGLNVKVLKLALPPDYDLLKHLQLNAAGGIDQNFKLVSQRNITINGTTAYESDYTFNGKNGSEQRKEVWIKKNNFLYSMIFTASGEIDENNINTMVKNLKINESNAGPKYDGWAEIVMPTINAKWKFSSWSLNNPGAVYHIPTSYFPGEKGEMALLGHHTTHHAPFLRISELKVGDEVIINDFLTQKKYVYVVESNGNDVRWGVEGTDIKFQPNEEPKLFLITCYPPGYSKAAWIVHCKLVSVEPLSITK